MNVPQQAPDIASIGFLPAFGLPEDRLARMAARRAFVEMKTVFMRAAADIEGELGALLQRKIRQSTEAIELWRLRRVVSGALASDHPRTAAHRNELRAQLNNVFPESGLDTSFVPL